MHFIRFNKPSNIGYGCGCDYVVMLVQLIEVVVVLVHDPCPLKPCVVGGCCEEGSICVWMKVVVIRS